MNWTASVNNLRTSSFLWWTNNKPGTNFTISRGAVLGIKLSQMVARSHELPSKLSQSKKGTAKAAEKATFFHKNGLKLRHSSFYSTGQDMEDVWWKLVKGSMRVRKLTDFDDLRIRGMDKTRNRNAEKYGVKSPPIFMFFILKMFKFKIERVHSSIVSRFSILLKFIIWISSKM